MPASLVVVLSRRVGLFWPSARPRERALAAACRRAPRCPRPAISIGELTYYVTQGDETLLDVARAAQSRRARDLGGQPGRRPLGAGCGDADHPADRSSSCPTRRARASSSITASCALFYFRKGGPVQTYAIGIGRDGFELKLGRTTDRAQEGEADLVPDRVDAARQAGGRHGGAARAGQPAGRVRPLSRLADLPDPRHQQALWRRPPGQPRLHPHVSRRGGAPVRAGGRSARR